MPVGGREAGACLLAGLRETHGAVGILLGILAEIKNDDDVVLAKELGRIVDVLGSELAGKQLLVQEAAFLALAATTSRRLGGMRRGMRSVGGRDVTDVMSD